MPWDAARFVVASRAARVSAVVESVRDCADAILSVWGIMDGIRGKKRVRVDGEMNNTRENEGTGWRMSFRSLP